MHCQRKVKECLIEGRIGEFELLTDGISAAIGEVLSGGDVLHGTSVK